MTKQQNDSYSDWLKQKVTNTKKLVDDNAVVLTPVKTVRSRLRKNMKNKQDMLNSD